MLTLMPIIDVEVADIAVVVAEVMLLMSMLMSMMSNDVLLESPGSSYC